MDNDFLDAEISELLGAFRQALIDLLPTASRLKLAWEDVNQHIDWERLASAVFDVCVRGPIGTDEAHIRDELPLPPYDINVPSYKGYSWIQALAGAPTSPAALIRLVSRPSPFDTAEVALLDPRSLEPRELLLLPVEEAQFSYYRRSATGRNEVIRSIRAIE